MDVKKLTHSKKDVRAALKELPDGRVVTTKALKIHIPVRFAERGLAFIGVQTQIIGVCTLILEDKFFSPMVLNALVKIEPTATVKTTVDDDEYYEFIFAPGSTVISSTNLIKDDSLIFKLYDEIISKGRVPYYLDYVSLGKLFDTAKKHADANVGQNQEVVELIISMIARQPNDRRKYYRAQVRSQSDMLTRKPAYIPLKSVIYGATNTVSKLGGSYFGVGTVSALVNPSERTERVEDLLRR